MTVWVLRDRAGTDRHVFATREECLAFKTSLGACLEFVRREGPVSTRQVGTAGYSRRHLDALEDVGAVYRDADRLWTASDFVRAVAS